MTKIIVTGGSSGLGKALVRELTAGGHNVTSWSLEDGVDLLDEVSISDAAFDILSEMDDILNPDPVYLINCAGINEISYIRDLTAWDFDNIMAVNAKALFLTTRALLVRGLLDGGTVVNIVSNAAHIPMTASLAYNASKGAACIMSKQMARELKKTNDTTVFSVSPNKLAGTAMSQYIEKRVVELRGWTPEQAKAYQLAALPAGEETDPDTLAEFIAFLLSSKQRHKFLNGCDITYGA